MNVPPLIIGAALLFWGIETENFLIGAVLCLLIEGSNLIKTRYALTEEDFVKISDLASLVFLGGVALVLINYKPIYFLRITAGWLPVILLPLITAQLYSTSDTIVIGTRLGRKNRIHAHKSLDFRCYYLAICLFAAATANSRSPWFYPVLGFILGWFLWQNRGRSFSPLLFVLLMSASLGLGYTASVGMEMAQRQVIEKSRHFWRGYYRDKNSDPFKSHVNFGDMARLKDSSEIIMRVDASFALPYLFREANYSLFANGIWLGSQEGFDFLPPVDETRWNLIDPPHKDGKPIAVQYNLPKEKGLLPHPRGGYRLQSSTIFELEKNKSGVVRVADGASIVSYDLWYHPAMESTTEQPAARNLRLPDNEMYALQQASELIHPEDSSDAEKIDAIKRYFRKDFSYSLNLLDKEEYATPLGNFLLQRKSGFCEYYATATALLLRLYGIPSRYVVGYAIIEKSWLERKYVVRERHGHAWAEAFVDNRWVIVDTTPANWAESDINQHASMFERIQDLFYFIRNQYRMFRIGSGEEKTLFYSMIVIVLTSFLVLRIYRRMKLQQAERESQANSERSFARITSPFTPIIDALMQADVVRGDNEPFLEWVVRLNPDKEFDRSEFEYLYRLHLQVRHDPRGIESEEVERLRQGSEKFLPIFLPRPKA